MKSGVVFDLDETLIDRSATLRAYAALLWRDFDIGRDVPEADFVAAFLALEDDGRAPQPDLFERVAERFPKSALDPSAMTAHYSQFAWTRPRLAAGVTSGLAELRAAGVPLGIITNGDGDTQRTKLQFTRLDRLVDRYLISGEFGAAKPDRSIFLAMCSALAIDAPTSWFVGDHPLFDIWGAHQVGFRTIWLERIIRWPDDLDPCYTHKCVNAGAALQILGISAQHLPSAKDPRTSRRRT